MTTSSFFPSAAPKSGPFLQVVLIHRGRRRGQPTARVARRAGEGAAAPKGSSSNWPPGLLPPRHPERAGGREIGAMRLAPAAHLVGLAVEPPLQPQLLGVLPLDPPPQREDRLPHQEQYPHASPHGRHMDLKNMEPGRVLRHLCRGVCGWLLLLLGAAAATHLGKRNYILHLPD